MKSSISALILAATTAFAAASDPIQQVTLDERAVIVVPVATNRVTTISFPGPITAIRMRPSRSAPTSATRTLVEDPA